MANWYGTSRSNYFKVKDEASFRADMTNMNTEVYVGEPGYFMVQGNDEGYWTSYKIVEKTVDGFEDVEEEIDFFDEVSKHLAEGSIAVFVSAGAEKLRYVTGSATAIDSKGNRVNVDINDIYDLAETELDGEVTKAEY